MALEQKMNARPNSPLGLTPIAALSAWQRSLARPKWVALLSGAPLLCRTALVQQKPDPPLPLPTESQLQRGRELCDKIVYGITSVPLSDAPAVLKVLSLIHI